MKATLMFSILVILIPFSAFAKQQGETAAGSKNGKAVAHEATSSNGSEEMSIFDAFRSEEQRAERATRGAARPKKVYISAIPNISSSPVTGLVIGGALTAAWVQGGDPRTTNFSVVDVAGGVTAKHQSALSFGNFIYSRNNEWILQGTLNWRIFPNFTWGLGGNTPDGWAGELKNSGVQVDQMLLKKVANKWYVGGGVNMNWIYEQRDENTVTTVQYIDANRSQEAATFWNTINTELPFVIKDEAMPSQFPLDWLRDTPVELQRKYFNTPFSIYPYGTGNTMFVLGMKAGLIHDSRDNQSTTRDGTYLNVNYSLFLDALGNEQNWGVTKGEVSKYVQLGSWKNVFAGRLFGAFSHGQTPYTSVPASGIEPRARSTRGITSYRYRSGKYISTDLEYRRHLWKFLGGVAFANLGSNSEEEIYLDALGKPLSWDGKFKYVNPGYGVGLRFILNEKTRTTFSLDYAWNKYSFTDTHSDGKRGELYIGMNAAF